nr:MAG TPA: hypothetical protein [Caudoviricetes sp.]DAN84367.1 MAG TPA: hypothetical protein [Caudoviricetes sp.]DAQ56816.1 MAG TPA: hypothetical protein [Caudoviricetes sp.]
MVIKIAECHFITPFLFLLPLKIKILILCI